jgi:hypothetical protein
MTARLHVVGAGLAGLACAVAAARTGLHIVLHEAAGHAGGRCRSFRDDATDRIIDNGTHLLLGVNQCALRYATAIGGLAAMSCRDPRFPFTDLTTGQRWELTPARLMTRPFDLARAIGLPWVGKNETVGDRLGASPRFHGIWEPLCVAALNTAADQSSARMFARLLRATLAGGAKALKPWLFPQGLSAALVDPALRWLTAGGAEIRFHHRLSGVAGDRLSFEDGTIRLGPDDHAVLALPPWRLERLMADVPRLSTRAIVNAHFRLDRPATLPGGQPFLGTTGGNSQWLSLRNDVLSVTVSAADQLADRSADEVAATLWAEIAPLVGSAAAPLPRHRIVKERRATLAHTPDEITRRWPATTPWPNIHLAGDWLDGPWPCTIEAAVASGLKAARLATGSPRLAFT